MSIGSVMPKQPLYKSLEVYQLSRKLVVACYELTHDLNKEDADNFIRLIRTAALDVHVNIARAAFSSSEKKKKPFKAARRSIVIIDAAVEILVEVGFATADQADAVTYFSASLMQLLDSL